MAKKIVLAIISGALFGALTYALGVYDRGAIGPGGSEVGFSKINGYVHQMTGVNDSWYELTELLGNAAICVAAVFAFIGLFQLVRRRSLLLLDRVILALGILYAVVIGFYVMFEKVVINCRPVLISGDIYPEPSYPSSHTMLVIAVMGSAMMLIKKFIRNKALNVVLRAACAVLMLITVVGRLWSGYHWFTDIVGGVLLSICLLSLYSCSFNRKGMIGGYSPKH